MQTSICPNCGRVGLVTDEFCPRCGTELSPVESGRTQEEWAHSDRHSPQPPFPQLGSGRSYDKPLITPFTGVGSVFAPTFNLFLGNIWFITKLVFVVFAPLEILKVLQFGRDPNNWQTVAGITLLTLACKALIAPALIYGILSKIRTGATPGLNECYRWGLSRLPKLAACVIMAWTVSLVGFACLIIPGIILSVAFELVQPMASLENRGPVEILKRSWELTMGHKRNIFLSLVCVALIAGLVNLPLGGIALALASNEIQLWPVDALLAMLYDIANEITTILSLVIYLSILQTSRGQRYQSAE